MVADQIKGEKKQKRKNARNQFDEFNTDVALNELLIRQQKSETAQTWG